MRAFEEDSVDAERACEVMLAERLKSMHFVCEVMLAERVKQHAFRMA